MSDLNFDGLPDLPQVVTLERIARALWGRDDVAALWLGGSFARGEADEFSDLDLRVAVASESFDAWSIADPTSLIGEPVVGVQSMGWDRTVLHHSVLGSGVILDLLVQSADREPPEDHTLVLGCRDAALGQLLSAARLPPTEELAPADPAAIRDALISFWIGSHKHVRMLHRGLDLLVLIGLGMEQSVLMRLWYAEATGRDQGTQRATIHTLTPTVRAVTEATGSHGLETLGSARTGRAEIVSVVEANRDEVAALGRRLAAALGFDYPEALEQAVRGTWRQYLDGAPKEYAWATKRLGAAAIITDGRGYVLMVKHSYGPLNWEIPGGAADADESVADTAVREVREETGLDVTAEWLTGMYYWADNDSHHFVFRCSVAHEGQEPLSVSDETTDCGFFPPDALPRPISDFTVRRIQDALAGDSPLLPVTVGPRQWLE